MKTNPKPAKVKVTRVDLRKRKIILVIEPELFSNEVFAVNAFYDEGEKKNKLQYIDVLIKLHEENGKITVSACEYNGQFYTTGHTQINDVNNMFVNKKDRAINEITKCPFKYIEDESRINQLLKNWDKDTEFKNELILLINNRKEENKKKEFAKALNNYEAARKELENAMILNGFEKPEVREQKLNNKELLSDA